MEKENFDSAYNERHAPRHNKTIEFLKRHVNTSEKILDLGVANNLSKLMIDNGYQVTNTPDGIDLDTSSDQIKNMECDVMTAFEIFEHLVSPFPLLLKTQAKKLVASVPLRLWFATAYWNEDDPYDRHYHEFEPRQFDMLLNKAGWVIKDSEKWVSKPDRITGVRSFFRHRTPRHYIVYCERN
ncbi:MAG: methyltransferase [Flavobacteriales bacterium]|nr:methyltransferase [Flavobacteriales bacterium]